MKLHQGEVSRTYDWMQGSSKSSNCQRVIKKHFLLQWTGEQYQKGWKPFSTNNHIEMQNTPPKQEKTSWAWPKIGKINRFRPNFSQFSAQPANTYFVWTSLVFHTDSISVEISSNTFRDFGILYKMWSMLITRRQPLRQTDLGWQPNIDLLISTTLRTTHEHIFYIAVFGISYRFHMCQNFEQHFPGSWDFVENVKWSVLSTHRWRLRQTDLGWQ